MNYMTWPFFLFCSLIPVFSGSALSNDANPISTQALGCPGVLAAIRAVDANAEVAARKLLEREQAILAMARPTRSSRVPRGLQTALGILSEARSRTNPEGTVPLSKLKRGDVIIHERQGLIEFRGYDSTTNTLTYRDLSFLGSSESKISPKPNESQARIGTVGALQAMDRRAAERYGHVENVPLLLALKILTQRALSSRTSLQPLIRQYDTIVKELTRNSSTLTGQPTSEDFAKFTENLTRSLCEPGQKEVDPAKIALLRSFLARAFSLTGEDIVRTGVLEAMEKHGTKTTLFWPPPRINKRSEGVLVLHPAGVGSGFYAANRNRFVDGNIVGVPPDIFHHLMYKAWNEGIGEVSSSEITAVPPTIHVVDYLSKGHPNHDTDTTTQAIVRFTETGDSSAIKNILDESAGRLGDYFRNIASSAGQSNVMILPVPSGSGRKATPTTSLAQELSSRFGLPLNTNLITLKNQSAQTVQPYLWDRLQNAASMRLTVKGDLSGKTVILIDDIGTTGATEAQLRRQLLEEYGVTKVYFLNLARTTSR
ncbi:MAG: phosphoribosyltransferase [Deltaproteobacteria bacterium]|nr:phosphoribosyltransferase [Deltaproteobacteria bacterium]